MPLPKSKRIATPDEALDSTKETPRLRVGFVLTPRFTLTAFAGFVDALRLAADEGDRSRPIDCAWAILGDPAQPIVSSCGASMVPTHSMKSPERYDYIVVVGGLVSALALSLYLLPVLYKLFPPTVADLVPPPGEPEVVPEPTPAHGEHH